MFRWRIYSATTMDQPELIPNTCFSGGETWAPGGEHANSTQESNPTPSYCEARVLTSLHPPPLLQLIPTKKCFGLCLFGCGLLFLSHACETSEPPLKKKEVKNKRLTVLLVPLPTPSPQSSSECSSGSRPCSREGREAHLWRAETGPHAVWSSLSSTSGSEESLWGSRNGKRLWWERL